jgi:hypothetical protein
MFGLIKHIWVRALKNVRPNGTYLGARRCWGFTNFKMEEPTAKRQRILDDSILSYVMELPQFIESMSHQVFARLSRTCRTYRDQLTLYKELKIKQLLESYSMRTNEPHRAIGVSRAFRMFQDKQITEQQYRTLYNAFYAEDPQPLLDLDMRDEYNRLKYRMVTPISSQYIGLESNGPIIRTLRRSRYPFPLELMPVEAAEYVLELAFQGHDLFTLGRATELKCQYPRRQFMSDFWSLEDIDFDATAKLLAHQPELYSDIPGYIYDLLVNEPNFTTSFRLSKQIINVDLFVSSRKRPYELKDVKLLGFSADTFAAAYADFRLIPPPSVLEWLHQNNPGFLIAPDSICLRRAFVRHDITEQNKSSFEYIRSAGLSEGLIRILEEEGRGTSKLKLALNHC